MNIVFLYFYLILFAYSILGKKTSFIKKKGRSSFGALKKNETTFEIFKLEFAELVDKKLEPSIVGNSSNVFIDSDYTFNLENTNYDWDTQSKKPEEGYIACLAKYKDIQQYSTSNTSNPIFNSHSADQIWASILNENRIKPVKIIWNCKSQKEACCQMGCCDTIDEVPKTLELNSSSTQKYILSILLTFVIFLYFFMI
uniref:CX domain-containing protein n=1 Tax=Rhabditophanes sp. KR3021 TaxID=114890 RepID=A0AC35TMS9_9BILA